MTEFQVTQVNQNLDLSCPTFLTHLLSGIVYRRQQNGNVGQTAGYGGTNNDFWMGYAMTSGHMTTTSREGEPFYIMSHLTFILCVLGIYQFDDIYTIFT